MSSALLWKPSEDRVHQSQMFKFMTTVASRHGVQPDWQSLRRWSIERRDLFWNDLLEFAEVKPSRPADATMRGEGMMGTKWFPGMTLNYARHMLRFNDDQDAILAEDERGRAVRLSHRERATRWAVVRLLARRA